MSLTWLFEEEDRRSRLLLSVQSGSDEWGTGEVTAEEELPPAPTNLKAQPGNGRVLLTWDPVPDAMYYNVYYMTTKGVQIKFSELTRPIAGPKDFKTKVHPDWCPGCGDFGVLNALQKACAELGIPPHTIVNVSGIGCSSNFPGYFRSYGMHTLHGRALPHAAGSRSTGNTNKVRRMASCLTTVRRS